MRLLAMAVDLTVVAVTVELQDTVQGHEKGPLLWDTMRQHSMGLTIAGTVILVNVPDMQQSIVVATCTLAPMPSLYVHVDTFMDPHVLSHVVSQAMS